MGKVNEVCPGLVAGFCKGGVKDGAPAWGFGFTDETHAGLGRGAVGFAGVAGDAGADDIIPCHFSSLFPRDDVVEIELGTVEFLTAVLAGIFVAFEDVLSGKFDFTFRHAVVQQ